MQTKQVQSADPASLASLSLPSKARPGVWSAECPSVSSHSMLVDAANSLDAIAISYGTVIAELAGCRPYGNRSLSDALLRANTRILLIGNNTASVDSISRYQSKNPRAVSQLQDAMSLGRVKLIRTSLSNPWLRDYPGVMVRSHGTKDTLLVLPQLVDEDSLQKAQLIRSKARDMFANSLHDAIEAHPLFEDMIALGEYDLAVGPGKTEAMARERKSARLLLTVGNRPAWEDRDNVLGCYKNYNEKQRSAQEFAATLGIPCARIPLLFDGGNITPLGDDGLLVSTRIFNENPHQSVEDTISHLGIFGRPKIVFSSPIDSHVQHSDYLMGRIGETHFVPAIAEGTERLVPRRFRVGVEVLSRHLDFVAAFLAQQGYRTDRLLMLPPLQAFRAHLTMSPANALPIRTLDDKLEVIVPYRGTQCFGSEKEAAKKLASEIFDENSRRLRAAGASRVTFYEMSPERKGGPHCLTKPIAAEVFDAIPLTEV